MVANVLSAGPVTPAERKLANALDAEASKMLWKILRWSSNAGYRIIRNFVREYRAGNDPFLAVSPIWSHYEDALGQLATLTHLKGVSSLQDLIPDVPLEMAIGMPSYFKSALLFLKRKVGLSQQKLQFLETEYGREAGRVIKGVRNDIESKLRASIADSFAKKKSTEQAARALLRVFRNAGITPRNSSKLETIYRTQTALAFAAGRWEVESNAAVQDILWGYKYVTVGDDRVRPTHRAMEGITLPKGHPFWLKNMPPNGWNCRCTVIPLFAPAPLVRPKAIRIYSPLMHSSRVVRPVADPGWDFNAGEVGVKVMSGLSIPLRRR